MIYSLVPSIIFIAGFLYFLFRTILDIFRRKKDILILLSLLVAIFTFFSFIYFITVYPYFTDGSYNINADTIKSIYIAPVINLLSLFGSLLIVKLDKNNSFFSNLIITYCFVLYLINLNTYTVNF